MNQYEQSQYEQKMSAIPEQGTIMRARIQAGMRGGLPNG